ncbi:MAG: (Fe-S)-binding protein, partial [Deltaproteobacteria bacterium]
EWRELGSPQLILACSTCHSIFAKRLPREKIVSLWEILDRVGLPEAERIAPRTMVSVHDPCTARHEPQIHASVRSLLGKLGFEIDELSLSKEKTECCSFGGLMYFANRDLADEVIRRRIEETSENMLAYCAMCRDCFASAGKPTWHLLDLVFGESGIEAATVKGPDYSQRRENRARLKRSLLRELWDEESPGHEDFPDVTLHIADHVRDLMERRMILVEDLQQVIRWAEKTGNRLVHRETGNYLAHYRPGTVTYWVEYSRAEDGYTVHNAYTHRMEIVEEIKR